MTPLGIQGKPGPADHGQDLERWRANSWRIDQRAPIGCWQPSRSGGGLPARAIPADVAGGNA